MQYGVIGAGVSVSRIGSEVGLPYTDADDA